jgi:hypothetical protein
MNESSFLNGTTFHSKRKANYPRVRTYENFLSAVVHRIGGVTTTAPTLLRSVSPTNPSSLGVLINQTLYSDFNFLILRMKATETKRAHTPKNGGYLYSTQFEKK